MTLGAVALLTASGLVACGDDDQQDSDRPGNSTSSSAGEASLENASDLLTEHSGLNCTGPAVFDGDDSGNEYLHCAWNYAEGPPPEGELEQVMLWSDADVPDQDAALQANHDRPGGVGSTGAELTWTHFERLADLGGYLEGAGTRGVCHGPAEACSDLADDLGWTFKSNGDIASEMKAYTGWDNLEHAIEDLRDKEEIFCTEIDDVPSGGEAANCRDTVLTFGLTMDDLEEAGLFDEVDNEEVSKVEDGDWRMVCRNNDLGNCETVADYTGQEVAAL